MSDIDFHCVVCKSAEIGNTVSSSAQGDKSGTLQVVECSACGHAQLHPPVYSQNFYEEDGQVNNVIETYGTPFETLIEHSWIEARRRLARFKKHGVDLCKQNSNSLDVIDVGGGYGFFGKVLAENIPYAKVCVLDPSRARIEKGRELMTQSSVPESLRFSGELLDEKYADTHNETFDLVTMWHVLEHLTDPVGMLQNAYKLLRKGGALCVEVPNLNDELMGLSSAFRDRSFIVEHISYFSPSLLEKAARIAIPDGSIKVTGYQRYGIFNYFHWVHFNRPQGENPDLFEGTDRMWLETTWRAVRESACTSDALFMIIRKP